MDGGTNVIVGEAQRRIEGTPTETLELPQEKGAFELDPAVVDGKFGRHNRTVYLVPAIISSL
jgi:hypothetical protein